MSDFHNPFALDIHFKPDIGLSPCGGNPFPRVILDGFTELMKTPEELSLKSAFSWRLCAACRETVVSLIGKPSV